MESKFQKVLEMSLINFRGGETHTFLVTPSFFQVGTLSGSHKIVFMLHFDVSYVIIHISERMTAFGHEW